MARIFLALTPDKDLNDHIIELKKELKNSLLSDAEISNWTLSHAYYSDMGGFCFRTSSLWSHGKDCQLQYITADDLLKLRAKGHIATITEHEIKDKSNGDCIVKAMAVIQVSWLVIQVMLRATRNFPISQLEITACAFAA